MRFDILSQLNKYIQLLEQLKDMILEPIKIKLKKQN